MKFLQVFSCLLILSLTLANYAEARSRSFSGGFGAQRTAPRMQPAPAAQAPAPAAPAKSGFGSFGAKPGAAGSGAPQASPSLNMSKDLSTSGAQANALKTNDMRSGAPASGAPVSGTGAPASGASGTGWFRSGTAGQSAPRPGATQVATAASAPVMQSRGGGFMQSAMWFMLGSSLASHHTAAATPPAQAGSPASESQANSNPVSGENAQALDPATGMVTPAEEPESLWLRMFRLALWAAIIYGIYKLVRKLIPGAPRPASKKPNYTFGN